MFRFLEQTEGDIETANTAVEQAKAGLANLHKELEKLVKELGKKEVCFRTVILVRD